MKVFISMPMNGKTSEETIKRRSEVVGPVWCLGYSIQKMEDADLVVLDKGWREARGCKVEYDVCSYYGFRFLEI